MLDSKNAILSHSSHFTNTSNAFWVNVMIAETNAYMATGNPHGNANSTDADIIAVAESWAEHVARSFAHFKYRYNNSINPLIANTFEEWLEKQRNEMENHIPIGLYHDLIDGINTNEIATDKDNLSGSSGYIDDNVIGITNFQIFSLLNSNTTSISVLKNNLNSSGYVQSPNTSQDITDLFISY